MPVACIRASAHGHGEYPSLAVEAARLAKSGKGPIIIVGHSMGADAAVHMANELKNLGTPVALLVLFNPTTHLPIPSNVRQVVNYYQSNSAWRGTATKGQGFHGSIANINLEKDANVTHFNMESLPRLQSQAMAKIAALTGTGRPLPSATATASASPMTATDAPSSVATPPTRGGTAAASRATASSNPAPSKRSLRRAAASKPAVETTNHYGVSY